MANTHLYPSKEARISARQSDHPVTDVDLELKFREPAYGSVTLTLTPDQATEVVAALVIALNSIEEGEQSFSETFHVSEDGTRLLVG